MKKRSVKISGHATSISLEEPFWEALKDIAREEGKSLNRLISEIDESADGNLSSAIRLTVLARLQEKIRRMTDRN